MGGGGQRWTTLDALATEGHALTRPTRAAALALVTEPTTAIGQRALIVRAPHGNVIWDRVPCVDDATIQVLASMGGLAAIAISHPHFSASMVTWSSSADVG